MTFSLIILANCVCDESCEEKLAPISPRVSKFVAQIDFCVHRLRLCNYLISAKFSLSLLLTGKFRRGMIERFRLKRIITRGVYQVIQQLLIAYPVVCRLRMTMHVQNLL